uniref:Glycoprotein hormone subunit alpha 2 n=1 Tax=Pseudonaja textilis TaxID=8673 RepID=A0A670ZLP9_PSETE
TSVISPLTLVFPLTVRPVGETGIDAVLFLLSSPAFNVTLRSDRQGVCRGTRPIQACVGYCESSAFPSKYSVLLASSFKHNITSVSQCCTISRMQTVKLRLRCHLGLQKTVDVFTAKTCQCDVCRLSRY